MPYKLDETTHLRVLCGTCGNNKTLNTLHPLSGEIVMLCSNCNSRVISISPKAVREAFEKEIEIEHRIKKELSRC